MFLKDQPPPQGICSPWCSDLCMHETWPPLANFRGICRIGVMMCPRRFARRTEQRPAPRKVQPPPRRRTHRQRPFFVASKMFAPASQNKTSFFVLFCMTGIHAILTQDRGETPPRRRTHRQRSFFLFSDDVASKGFPPAQIT